jgi:hypothetical protein
MIILPKVQKIVKLAFYQMKVHLEFAFIKDIPLAYFQIMVQIYDFLLLNFIKVYFLDVSLP